MTRTAFSGSFPGMNRLLLPLLFICVSLHGEPFSEQTISTGKGARVEHALKGGLARFGSNTQAQILKDGSLSLEQGLSLISSASGMLRRQAVTISTPAGGITVRGTALIARLADGSLKITSLEGKVKSSLKGASQGLESGQLLRVPKSGPPTLAQVELASLTQTCALLGPEFAPLSQAQAIATLSEIQSRSFAKGTAPSVPAGPEMPGQPNAQGASNMVAIAAAFSDGQSLANASTSDITYSSSSTSMSSSGAVLTMASGGVTFSSVLGGSQMTGSTLSLGGSLTKSVTPVNVYGGPIQSVQTSNVFSLSDWSLAK